MGAFFDDISSGVVSAVKDGAGNVVKTAETSFSEKINGVLGNSLPTKIVAPLPEMDDISKQAVTAPPASGIAVGSKDTLAAPGTVDRATKFYRENKALCLIAGGLVAVGLITGAIKLKGG